ncbi:MAG: hypothetical protein ACK4RK_08655 [Gemmataceae bacterium]
MKRTVGAMILLAAVGGCVASDGGGSGPGPMPGGGGGAYRPRSIPGVQGPRGEPVAMAAPYSASSMGEEAAKAMLAQSVPLDMIQHLAPPGGIAPVAALQRPGDPNLVVHAGGAGQFTGALPGTILPAGAIAPPGVPFAPGLPPPGAPGLPMGGGGVRPPGAVAALGAITDYTPTAFPAKRTEVRFVGPPGMRISWYAPGPDGKQGFNGMQLEAPARYNFIQAAIYRLKLSAIPNRPGLELYPTLEVVPGNPKTEAFLAHSAVPVFFTEEDFEQVASGNYVVKVIYLPDPQYQDLAYTGPGPDEVVSSRLEPGVDPIKEACRRGSILVVIRLGNIDLEAPNTPPMDAPSPYAPKAIGIPASMTAPGQLMMPPYPPMGPQGPMGMPMPPMGPQGPMGMPMPPMGPQGPMGMPMPPMGPQGPMGMPMPPNRPLQMPPAGGQPHGPIAMNAERSAPANSTPPGVPMLPPMTSDEPTRSTVNQEQKATLVSAVQRSRFPTAQQKEDVALAAQHQAGPGPAPTTAELANQPRTAPQPATKTFTPKRRWIFDPAVWKSK